MFLALAQDIPVDHVVPLAQYDNRISISNSGNFSLLSNICPHQKSRIAQCSTQHLQCPYHGLRFDRNGKGIGNTHELETWPVYKNQTILFDQHVSCEFPVDTKFMVLEEQRIDFVKSTTSIIMDVFLDIEHIPVAHANVYDQIGISNISNLTYSLFENGSIQYVPAQTTDHIIADDQKYNLGACWMAIYPGTMIEWQPGAMFVTVASDTAQGARVWIYKYRDTRYSDQSYTLNSHVWETAWQQDQNLASLIADLPDENLDSLKQHHRQWIENAV